MSPTWPSRSAVARAVSTAIRRISTSSLLRSDWFGHSILNSRTSSMTCLNLSFAQRDVTALPSRVSALAGAICRHRKLVMKGKGGDGQGVERWQQMT